MSSNIIKKGTRPIIKQVKQFISANREEARQRVLKLYKTWYRQCPYIVMDYDVPVTVQQCRTRLREEFLRYKNVNDIRAIDVLVSKGQMDLVETAEMWKQRGHIMDYFNKDLYTVPKSDFLSSFYAGKPYSN